MPEIDDKEKIRALIENKDISITANIEEKYVVTTEDKIRILYDKYNTSVRVSSNTLAWLGIFITILITDFTCSFKQIWIIPSEIVAGFFYVSTVFLGVATIRSIYVWSKKKKDLEFAFFLNQLKGDKQEKEPQNGGKP